MDYQEFAAMAQKARRETEDFINHHIHDQGKRWPVIRPSERITQDTVQIELSGTSSHIRTAAGLSYPLSVRVQADISGEDNLYQQQSL